MSRFVTRGYAWLGFRSRDEGARGGGRAKPWKPQMNTDKKGAKTKWGNRTYRRDPPSRMAGRLQRALRTASANQPAGRRRYEERRKKGAAVVAPRRPFFVLQGLKPLTFLGLMSELKLRPPKHRLWFSTCRPCRHRQAYRHRRLRQRPSCRLPGCRPRELPW